MAGHPGSSSLGTYLKGATSISDRMDHNCLGIHVQRLYRGEYGKYCSFRYSTSQPNVNSFPLSLPQDHVCLRLLARCLAMIPVDKLESIVGNTKVRGDCKPIRIFGVSYGTLRLTIIP